MKIAYQSHAHKTSTTQTVFQILLGAMLLLTGTGHLTWQRAAFQAQVPTWIPMNADLVVVLSGIVELALAAALILLWPKRTTIGWLAALFFILVFPGNIAQFVEHRDAFGLDTDLKRGIRLLFQPLLVGWALWATGAWQEWRSQQAS